MIMLEIKEPRKRHTQAVVIIHGIGEQRPMSTLRRFVDAVLPMPAQGGEKYFSKPDKLSNSFELRKLQDRSQPRTHFYEYYWAYQVEGTKLSQIGAWLKMLLWRKPRSVPKQLRSLWGVSWFLLGIIALAVALDIGSWMNGFLSQYPGVLLSGLSLLSTLVFSGIQFFVFFFVGDVARYLTPLPSNIKLRQAIRTEGLALLKKVHEDGEYERVILVGHSLGSMIAYDLLKYLWQDYKEVYRTPTESKQEAFFKVEEIGDCLENGIAGVTVEQYMSAQIDAWKEMRKLGNPWLVTDLITLGSPLAHAALLLADDEQDLRARQKQRELPTDPPEPEVEGKGNTQRCCYSYEVWDRYGEKKNIKLRAFHHGGHFAFTRWTNLYYPGDLAGGPITVFGKGVRNIAVDSGNRFLDYTIRAHTHYWDKTSMKPQARANSVAEIIKALDLKNYLYFEG
jgi:hypothetical protein